MAEVISTITGGIVALIAVTYITRFFMETGKKLRRSIVLENSYLGGKGNGDSGEHKAVS